MKKIVSLVLALVLALSLVACGNSGSTTQTPAPSTTPDASATPGNTGAPEVQDPAFSADLTQFYNDIMNAAGEAPFMMDMSADPDMLEMTYPGLKDIETKQLVAAMPMLSAVAVEFVFVEVANAADVDAVKAILQGRIDAQIDGGAWYPETIEQWEKYSEIVVIDNYVCMFVTADKDGMIEAFRTGSEVPSWAEVPEVSLDLLTFYYDIFNELYPVDEEGYSTGPYCEDMAVMPEMLEGYYPGLTEIATNQLHVFLPMMSAVAFEVALIEVADEADVAAVEAILQARIDAQVDGGAWYPETIEQWEMNSRITSNGRYILMAVGTDCDYFIEAFGWQF